MTPDFTKLPYGFDEFPAPTRDARAAANASLPPWTSPDGLDHRVLYEPSDAPHVGGAPGTPPFLGGPYATMYAKRPWTIRQYAGFSTAEKTNAFYRQALQSGQQGLSVAFDRWWLGAEEGFD